MKTTCFFCVCMFSFFAILDAKDEAKSGCLEKEKALALLETAEDLLLKAKIYFPSCKEEINSTNNSECEGKKPLAYIEISKKLISEVRENFPTCINPKVIIEYDKPTDCSDILASGRKESGVYTIWPSGSNANGKQLQVYCDMETDGGGWTMIQRRGKFPVQQDFNQNWETYKNGFGNITQEFWLGNEKIRILCDKGCEIRFDLQDSDGEKRFAVYKSFKLSGSDYTIYINNYTGDAGDGMRHCNMYIFSTKEKGNTRAAETYRGGWWHCESNMSNLNGIYKPGGNGNQNVYWYHWRTYHNIDNVQIKVKPK